MAFLTGYWAAAGWPLRLMLIALALFPLPLFFDFAPTTGHLVFDDYSSQLFFNSPGGTGWRLHPYAPVILIGLAIAYLTPLHTHKLWMRFGWLLTPLLLFFCMMNGDNTWPAPNVAFIILDIAIVAMVLHYWALWRGPKATPGP